MDWLWALVHTPKPSMACNSCGHFCLRPIQRHCQTGWFCSYKSWGCKMPTIPWPPKHLPLSTSGNWDHWCMSSPLVCMASLLPLFWVVLQRNLLMYLLPQGVTRGFTSTSPQLWSGEPLPAYWPVCRFDLILSLSVIFLVAFNVLTSITTCHLPLSQCTAIALGILVLFVSFIAPSVVQCYLVRWWYILWITQHMMRLQHGAMLHIACNIWGTKKKM